MLLFCDDNWGNVRILPKKEDQSYKGGFGMYYHFDFVGGPVSYRWLNVTQIERVWEQMNLTYSWGVKDLWLVNVGDLKPMELPISFFLDYAGDVDAIKADDLPAYYQQWAQQQFGAEHAEEIAEILSLYTKFNARRTPEMLTPETYSLAHYREADEIVTAYQQLVDKSREIYKQLPESHRSAFYQLVLSPVEMCSNLNEMYVAAGKNMQYAKEGRASTNYYADQVKELFFKDAALTRYYHEELENGKWNHMMSQTHIGYTNWNNPPVNKMPAVSYIQPNSSAELGFLLEQGTNPNWSGFKRESSSRHRSTLAPFDPINDQDYYIEIFNKGTKPLTYTVTAKEDWINLSSKGATIQFDEKVFVSIDWKLAPKGQSMGELILSGEGRSHVVEVPIRNDLSSPAGFVENNGIVVMEAADFTHKNDTEDLSWTIVPNLGRTSSSITVLPANAERQHPKFGAPSLSYEFTVFNEGGIGVKTYLSPSLNYQKNEGLLYAMAIDEEAPQIINMHEGETQPDWEYPEWWNNSVTDHIKVKSSSHTPIKAGTHTLKIWMIDPGVVFQKFVIDMGGLMPSYLGPPPSLNLGN